MLSEINWDASWMKDEEIKKTHRENPFSSLVLLTSALLILNKMISRFANGLLSLFSEVCLSMDCWNIINYARLWTEENHDEVDQLLQTALGNLADVHFMIESVWVEEKVNSKALDSIINAINFALEDIRKAIELIEVYVDDNLGGENT